MVIPVAIIGTLMLERLRTILYLAALSFLVPYNVMTVVQTITKTGPNVLILYDM